MSEELLKRQVTLLDLTRVLEAHFGCKIRFVNPLLQVNLNGTVLTSKFIGVEVGYEEPLSEAVRQIIGRTANEERGGMNDGS